jgi:hypothetical protein
MNTPKSDKHPGDRPRPDEKKRTEIETPEEKLYTDTGTPPGDETYRPHEERYARGETRRDERYDTTPPYRSDAETGNAGSLRGIDELESDLVNLARNTISNTLRATGAVGTEAVDVTRTTVNAAAQGIGDIGTTAITSVRDILVSVVEGIKDVAGAALPKSYHGENRYPPGASEYAPPREYTPPPDRPRPPDYVPPADNKEPV